MDFYNQKHAKARKSHKCEFCGKEIIPGETYSYESGKFDGARKRNGGLSVDDNKGLLFLGIILILIGLAGIKF